VKAGFITDLVIELVDDDKIWVLHEPLSYYSALIDQIITAKAGFYTDLASVPRVPVLYLKWGNRAHREAVIHDLTYCIDCIPNVSFDMANLIFQEAMISRGKPTDIVEGMYHGVCLGGKSSYHKRYVDDNLLEAKNETK
jgi:hypothetical protein